MTTVVVDAKVVISAVLGRSRTLIIDLVRHSDAVIPSLQAIEARVVAERIAGDAAAAQVNGLLEIFDIAAPDLFARFEAPARARLHRRGQPDWPVLATAMALDAAIWSSDVDFFGVGVPVWTTRNIHFAAPAQA